FISTIQWLVPPAFERLVKTCMAKVPDDRWQTAHDVMLELKGIGEERNSGLLSTAMVSSRKTHAKFAWGTACAFFITSIVLAFALLSTKQKPPGTLRLSINPPENTAFASSLALSFDGSRLAFTASDSNAVTHLWVRPLNSLSAQMLPGTENAIFPFWSPDGRNIGFFAQGKLKRIGIAGGPPVDLADVTEDARGGTWN